MKTDYFTLIKKFGKFKILVIGDFILDVYLSGTCTRLAPEASVPVVDINARQYCLGGAANAAANLSALGAKVFFCTVAGQDSAYEIAGRLLKDSGISTDFIACSPERETLVKTRIKSTSHTLVRFDEGIQGAIESDLETQLIHNLHVAYHQCDAVLVADYDKGTLSATVITELKKLKLQQDKFIAVDSKRLAAFSALAPDLIKPNYEEAIKLLNIPYSKDSRAEQLKPFGKHFQQKTNASVIALTIDNDGTLCFDQGDFIQHVPAPKVTSPSVSGAGDTFVSACMLALQAGAGIPAALQIATAAAGIAIAKQETAICGRHELINSLTADEKVILQLTILKRKCEGFRKEGKRIVFTNGCFDILHSGHVSYLQQAKAMGDVLVVGLNTDESIRRLKGKGRPVNTLENRLNVLSALGCIDHVVPFGGLKDDTPAQLLKLIRPDLFVKGADYKDKHLPEGKLLGRMGCKIAFLPYVFNQSTTEIIARINEPLKLKIAVSS